MNLRILRLRDDVSLPSYGTAGAAAFDLAVAEDTMVPTGVIQLVPTGLAVAVPEGHFLAIFARSSTPLKKGLMVANGVGVLDSDYCGPTDELRIQVINVIGEPVYLRAGDRIAQGMVLPVNRVTFVEETKDTWGTQDRGGFGSTGR